MDNYVHSTRVFKVHLFHRGYSTVTFLLLVARINSLNYLNTVAVGCKRITKWIFKVTQLL